MVAYEGDVLDANREGNEDLGFESLSCLVDDEVVERKGRNARLGCEGARADDDVDVLEHFGFGGAAKRVEGLGVDWGEFAQLSAEAEEAAVLGDRRGGVLCKELQVGGEAEWGRL